MEEDSKGCEVEEEGYSTEGRAAITKGEEDGRAVDEGSEVEKDGVGSVEEAAGMEAETAPIWLTGGGCGDSAVGRLLSTGGSAMSKTRRDVFGVNLYLVDYEVDIMWIEVKWIEDCYVCYADIACTYIG
jgi:hypothetical protein